MSFGFTATGRDLDSVSTLALVNLLRENGKNPRFIHGADQFSAEVDVQNTSVAKGDAAEYEVTGVLDSDSVGLTVRRL